MELRTVSEAVIRISLSFLQDCSASLGPMSTAWLWERLGDAACPRRKLILAPTHISKEAGTQPPVHSCSSSPQPSSLSNEHSILLWGGLGEQCSPSHSGQLLKGSCVSELLGHMGRAHVSCSGVHLPMVCSHFQSGSGKCSVELQEQLPTFPPKNRSCYL